MCIRDSAETEGELGALVAVPAEQRDLLVLERAQRTLHQLMQALLHHCGHGPRNGCDRQCRMRARTHGVEIAEAMQRGNPSEQVGVVDESAKIIDALYQLLPRGRCLLYTSDAAAERSSVDLGGRRIIKQKTKQPA